MNITSILDTALINSGLITEAMSNLRPAIIVTKHGVTINALHCRRIYHQIGFVYVLGIGEGPGKAKPISNCKLLWKLPDFTKSYTMPDERQFLNGWSAPNPRTGKYNAHTIRWMTPKFAKIITIRDTSVDSIKWI